MPWGGAISGANFKLNGAPSHVGLQLECECTYTCLWLSVVFYEVHGKTKKMPLGLARNRFFFVTARHKAGFASGKCTPGMGKVWERVPATFPERTTLGLDDCIPYPHHSPSDRLVNAAHRKQQAPKQHLATARAI